MKSFFKIFLVTLFLLLGVTVGTTMAIFSTPDSSPDISQLSAKNSSQSDPFEQEVLTEKVLTGRITMLLLGYDSSESRTDTIMMLCIDKGAHTLSLISIPRDTEVFFGGRRHKINSCIPYGGESLLFEQLKKLTNIKPDFYIKSDFKGFRSIIDLLGGVEFNVPRNMYYRDPYQKLTINLKKGLQTLNGTQAEQLVRFRGYTTGDIGRTQVQMDFMKALLEQKFSPLYLPKAPKLFSELAKYTDTNLTLKDVLQNLSALKLFTDRKVTTYQFPGQAKMINGISYFIIDKEKALEIFNLNFKAK